MAVRLPRSFSVFCWKPVVSILKTVLTPNPCLWLKPRTVTLTCFTAGLWDLASCQLVRLCQIDDQEGTEKLSDNSFVTSGNIVENERGRGSKIALTPVSRGLKVLRCVRPGLSVCLGLSFDFHASRSILGGMVFCVVIVAGGFIGLKIYRRRQAMTGRYNNLWVGSLLGNQPCSSACDVGGGGYHGMGVLSQELLVFVFVIFIHVCFSFLFLSLNRSIIAPCSIIEHQKIQS